MMISIMSSAISRARTSARTARWLWRGVNFRFVLIWWRDSFLFWGVLLGRKEWNARQGKETNLWLWLVAVWNFLSFSHVVFL